MTRGKPREPRVAQPHERGGAEERKLALLPVANFQSVTGEGVRGEVNGKAVAIGNRKLLETLNVDPGALVAMAGDGINDAPALAQAQVGIAMGTAAPTSRWKARE